MSEYKKQHIVSKTYLKHFSINNDGKNLFVIDNENQFEKGIQTKNSGDSIFWVKNYSDTTLFKDKKAIEKFFSKEIENSYNYLINNIIEEKYKISFKDKQAFMKWIFYTKLRSPIWGPANFKNSNSRRLHLNNFTDEERFQSTLQNFVQDAMNKRWTIYESPDNLFWWTSDNPGYAIDLKMAKKRVSVIPDPYCEISGIDSVLFYPLTKKYCLNIHPYNSGESLNLNLSNTNLAFYKATNSNYQIINYWTLISQARLIISTDKESLKEVEKIKLNFTASIAKDRGGDNLKQN